MKELLFKAIDDELLSSAKAAYKRKRMRAYLSLALRLYSFLEAEMAAATSAAQKRQLIKRFRADLLSGAWKIVPGPMLDDLMKRTGKLDKGFLEHWHWILSEIEKNPSLLEEKST